MVAWQEVAAQKQAQRTAKLNQFSEYLIPSNLIPGPDVLDVSTFCETSGLFTSQELEITNCTATEIASRIATGEFTCLLVVKACIHRTVVAQQLLNCVTEIYFEEALARAAVLDASFKSTGKVTGPLHGVVMSVKDQFQLVGLDWSMGYISGCNKPSTLNSTLVDCFYKAGAIIICKTNVPATLMMGESTNNVFGVTCNPAKRSLTSGGSSGGESALVSFKGTFLGTGTDIGGSIRSPASITGLYGLRPSHGRVSYHHCGNSYLGQEAIRSSAGPFARSPEDIALYMKSLIDQNQHLYDPHSLPIPWRDQAPLPKSLTFAFGNGNGTQDTATPPVLRALEETKAALLAKGHKIVELKNDDVIYEMLRDSTEIAFELFAADGGQDLARDLEGEPWHHAIKKWNSPEVAKASSVYDTWQVVRKRDALASRWIEHYASTGYDALVLPATPFAALPHEKPGCPVSTYEYCLFGCLSPLLQLTTAVFPVTKVKPIDVIPKDFVALSDHHQMMYDFYSGPEKQMGGPVGLQMIGKMYEEERITAILAEVASALKSE